MDNSILTALIASGSAFAGVVGGAISNYLVNIKIEKRKLRYQRREELFDQTSIFRAQIWQAYQYFCKDIKLDTTTSAWLENKKPINPYLKIEHLINLYFQELKPESDAITKYFDDFSDLAMNKDKSIDIDWKKSELEKHYKKIKSHLKKIQDALSSMK
ncbi:hypothetical protein [Pantoea ananatis]|uniref:hypothetical protein n=1 Tax=Pantoea ananas TaxID=553 RepID=UPI001B30FA9D|nr:hypothetical protein [Pantoea ananatis]